MWLLDDDRRPPFPDVPFFNSLALRELVQSCWSSDPRRRPSFTQIVRDMKSIRRNVGQNPDEASTPRKSEPLDDKHVSRPSPDMRPSPLPNNAYSKCLPDVV